MINARRVNASRAFRTWVTLGSGWLAGAPARRCSAGQLRRLVPSACPKAFRAAPTRQRTAGAIGLSPTRPHPIDSEVTHVLRGLVRRGVLSEEQRELVLEGFSQLSLTRFPADWLRARMWALRHNLSAYDATYVALAEVTGATALLTTDTRLANAPGPDCHIELLR